MTLGKRQKYLLAAASAALPALASIPAQADDGTWAQLSSGSATGSWSDANTASWAGGTVASGSGFTADFSQQNITTSSTIHLASARTIGNIIFGDTDLTNAGTNWTLDNNGNSANILTLAGTTPTITVNTLATNALATVSAVIDGTNGMTKAGPGILVVSGANTYSGGTTITGGTLRATVTGALGNGTAVVQSGAKLQVQNTISLANNIQLSGGSLEQVSGATVNATINGSLTLDAASTINLAANSGGIEITGNVTLGANQLNISGSRALTLSGILNGSGAISANTVNAAIILTQDNSSTYSGTISVSRSTLVLGTNGAAGSGTIAFGVNDQPSVIRSSDTTTRTIANVLTLVGANSNSIYTFGSTTASVNGDLNFTNTGTISLGNTRRFDVKNRTTIAAGLTSGSLIMQTGTGTLVLNGASNYTGGTTLNAGTLIVGANGTGSLGNTAVTVNTAAALGGNGSIGGTVTSAGGTINPGNNVGNPVGTLTVGGLTTTTGTLMIDVDTVGNTADKLVVTATPTLTTGASLAFSFGGFVGAYNQTFTIIQNNGAGAINGTFAGGTSFDNGQGLAYTLNYAGGDGNDLTVTFTSVPEPGSLSLLGLGALAMLKRRRRK